MEVGLGVRVTEWKKSGRKAENREDHVTLSSNIIILPQLISNVCGPQFNAIYLRN